jgi:hypothetical protein
MEVLEVEYLRTLIYREEEVSRLFKNISITGYLP